MDEPDHCDVIAHNGYVIQLTPALNRMWLIEIKHGSRLVAKGRAQGRDTAITKAQAWCDKPTKRRPRSGVAVLPDLRRAATNPTKEAP